MRPRKEPGGGEIVDAERTKWRESSKRIAGAVSR
jgi:hypothetical protein